MPQPHMSSGMFMLSNLGHEFENLVATAIVDVQNKHLDEIEGWVLKQIIHREGESPEDAFNRGLALFEEILSEVAGSWAEEIFADLVAARLVGPPFLVALDRITLGEVASREDDELSTHPSDGLRFEIVSKYLKRKLPHVYSDRVWSDLLQRRSYPARTELLPKLAKDVCDRCFEPFTSILDKIRSPLTDPVALTEKLRHTRQFLGDLAPPSAVSDIRSKEELSDAFWLLFYAAWHFRLHEQGFRSFRRRYGWSRIADEVDEAVADARVPSPQTMEAANDEEAKAEAAIGSLLLHSLQSLELRFLWNNKKREV